MQALADLQGHLRNAVVLGESGGIESILVGGDDPVRRLSIHRRHYRASLVKALVGRFPAVVWLAGSRFVTAAAEEFVRLRPPSRPCIAEYGESFPLFLSTRPGAKALSYLRRFAELEWHLGRLVLTVDRRHLHRRSLSVSGPALADSTVVLQPGLYYLPADWAVDELIAVYWSGRAPDRFTLQRHRVWLELRGSRGELSVRRLSPADFTFRARLHAGESLVDAAVAALGTDETFNTADAIVQLIDDGLVVAFESSPSIRTGSDV